MSIKNRDYFAEMYVAGVMADAGWNVYFPHRDQGFDLIATYPVDDSMIVCPVQVKGKYPTTSKTDKARYGYVGDLTALHDDMILVIPLFGCETQAAPRHIAWMPRSEIRRGGRGWRCEPARFMNWEPIPRRDFQHFFNGPGLERFRIAVN